MEITNGIQNPTVKSYTLVFVTIILLNILEFWYLFFLYEDTTTFNFTISYPNPIPDFSMYFNLSGNSIFNIPMSYENRTIYIAPILAGISLFITESICMGGILGIFKTNFEGTFSQQFEIFLANGFKYFDTLFAYNVLLQMIGIIFSWILIHIIGPIISLILFIFILYFVYGIPFIIVFHELTLNDALVFYGKLNKKPEFLKFTIEIVLFNLLASFIVGFFMQLESIGFIIGLVLVSGFGLTGVYYTSKYFRGINVEKSPE